MNFRKLEVNDLSLIRELELNNKSEFYSSSSDETWFNILFKKDSINLGIFINDELVGYSSAFILKRSKYKKFFTEIFNVDEKNTLFLNNTLISKKHRGNKYQYLLRQKTLEFFKGNNYITTVSTDNIYSINNMKKINMKIIYKGLAPYSEQLKYFFLGEK